MCIPGFGVKVYFLFVICIPILLLKSILHLYYIVFIPGAGGGVKVYGCALPECSEDEVKIDIVEEAVSLEKNKYTKVHY